MIPRRHFIRYTAAASLLAGFESLVPAYARPGRKSRASAGRIDLTIGKLSFDVGGKQFPAVAINGTVPGPLVRLHEGQDAVIRVANQLKGESTSIHWHGLILPFRMDGVPGVSFAGIGAGETFEYRFPVRQNGTYLYHSHTAAQEHLGVYGPLIIDPAEPEPFRYDREYVAVLGDWLSGDPMAMMAKLKKDSSYSNHQRRTVGDFIGEVSKDGLKATLVERWQWGKMRMAPTDIADITGHYFTFLLNGLAPGSNWTGLFRSGERVRLRFINASAVTFFDVRVPGLPMTVVQADGQNVKPETVDEFRIGIAETHDVIVQPKGAQAYTIFAESVDRSGYARGTLAVREGLSAAIPARRKRPVRTMADMGMAMSGGSDGGMAAMPGMKAKPVEAGAMPGMKMPGDAPMTDGGADVAIEALGTAQTFESALRSLRPGGTLSSLGVYSGKLQMPHDSFAAGLGDHRIVMTLCPGGKERMRRLLSLVQSGRFDPTPLITHRFSLDEIAEGYRLFGEQSDGVLKVAIKP